MSKNYDQAMETQRRNEAMINAGVGHMQQWETSLENIQDIDGGNGFNSAVISDDLRQYADQGYGADWINSMFELSTDQLSMNRNQAINKIGAAEMQSGFAQSGFSNRNRDQVNFGYGRQTGKILGGLEAQNEDVMGQAQRTIRGLETRGDDMSDYVDSLNEGFGWERDRRVQGREFGYDLEEYRDYQDNLTAQQQEKMAKYNFAFDAATLGIGA